METLSGRFSALFSFSFIITAILTFACFLSTNFIDYRQDVGIQVHKTLLKNIKYFYTDEHKDFGYFLFTLQADVSSVFNWNCKQLFLYFLAEYETPENKLNQVIIWDYIMKRGNGTMLNVTKQKSKYYFFDDGAFLRGNALRFSLHWNVIPNAGYLWRVPGIGNITVNMPDSYLASRV